jgi:hypothetical protein
VRVRQLSLAPWKAPAKRLARRAPERVWSLSMRAVLRIVLLVVIAFMLLAVVIAVGRGGTGVVEKVALAGAALLLVLAASVVRSRLA